MQAYVKKGAQRTKVPLLTTKRLHPVIVIDCSEWSQYMEVVVTADREKSPRSQSALVARIAKVIDALDKAQQGSGFRKIDVKMTGREMVAAFAPIEPEHARERIARICENLNTPDHALTKKTGIMKMTAHVA